MEGEARRELLVWARWIVRLAAAWGFLQVFTGPLSDRWGRKRLIAGGMMVQAGAIWLTVQVPLGALLAGVIADLRGLSTAIKLVAILTVISGLQVAWRMRKTLAHRRVSR